MIFDGFDDMMATQLSLPENHSVFFVSERGVQTVSTSSILRPVIEADNGSGLVSYGTQRGTLFNLDLAMDGSRVPTISNSWAENEKLITSATYQSPNLTGWKNGSLYGTAAISPVVAAGPINIGGSPNPDSIRLVRRFSGKISEIVICPALGDADRNKVEGYLAYKWGLQSNLPPSHPFRNNHPLVEDYWVPDSANLLRRYEADSIPLNDGDLVSSWVDSSPSADPAIQAISTKQPMLKKNVFNGHAVVRFDGSDCLEFSEILNTSSAKVSIFVVYKQDVSTPTGVLISNRQDGSSVGYTLRVNALSELWYFHTGQVPVIKGALNAGALTLASIDRDGLNVAMGINGSTGALTAIDGYLASGYHKTAIGAEKSATDGLFKGDIAEIIITNSILSADLKSRFEGYLAWKYGIQNQLPVSHPYKALPPTMAGF